MPFEIDLDGATFRTDDLTLNEAIEIEKATGRSWMQINPFRSAEDCKQIMAVWLARSMDLEAAREKIGAISLRDVLANVRLVEDDLPAIYEDGIPKVGDDPPTDG